MRRNAMAILAGLSLGVAILASAGLAAAGTQEDLEAIEKVRKMEVAGVNSGDPDNAVRAYADDVVQLAPNEPAIAGKSNIRAWIAGMYEQFDLKINYTSADVTVSGDWASEHYAGTATFMPKDGSASVTEDIKGIHIYKRQADGSWRITHDIWNTDAPAAAME